LSIRTVASASTSISKAQGRQRRGRTKGKLKAVDRLFRWKYQQKARKSHCKNIFA